MYTHVTQVVANKLVAIKTVFNENVNSTGGREFSSGEKIFKELRNI